MAIEQNSRNDWFDLNEGNGRGSFEEHNESMREFHSSHANVAMVNGTRLDEAALLERMESLRIRRNMMETGGSALSNDTTDWSALVPVLKVGGYKLSQN